MPEESRVGFAIVICKRATTTTNNRLLESIDSSTLSSPGDNVRKRCRIFVEQSLDLLRGDKQT